MKNFNDEKTISRDKIISRTSFISIFTNLILATLKIVFGSIAKSSAVVSDGINNLTDSSSSIITIVGTKLAKKRPTKKHPFGFGRIEYFTSLIIGVIVLVTGVETLINGIQGAIHPVESIDYSLLVMILMGVSILVKIGLGLYVVRQGKKTNSQALIASGKDAMLDSISTFLALIAGIIYISTNGSVSIDAYVSIAVSLLILKTGLETIVSTLSNLLGERADSSLAKDIRNFIAKEKIIISSHDLIINNYGPDRNTGSINVEIDHSVEAGTIYPRLHKLQTEIYQNFHTYIVFGIYAVDNKNPLTKKVQMALNAFLKEEKGCLGYHGICFDEENKLLYVDIVLDFVKNREELQEKCRSLLKDTCAEYTPIVTIDTEFA